MKRPKDIVNKGAESASTVTWGSAWCSGPGEATCCWDKGGIRDGWENRLENEDQTVMGLQ